MGRELEISLLGIHPGEITRPRIERVFAEIALQKPDALMVHDSPDLLAYSELFFELIAKSGLPAMYCSSAYVETGGLMSYQAGRCRMGIPAR